MGSQVALGQWPAATTNDPPNRYGSDNGSHFQPDESEADASLDPVCFLRLKFSSSHIKNNLAI